jgi:hypothetical protein
MFCSLSYKYFKLSVEYKWHNIQNINYWNKLLSIGLMNTTSYKYEVKLMNVGYYKVRLQVFKWIIEYYWFEIWIMDMKFGMNVDFKWHSIQNINYLN